MARSRRPSVLIADDHTLVAAGLRRLLEAEFEVVGTVGDGRALLDAARRLRPDVVLVDISMPGLNGIDAARRLRTLTPSSKIVILTMHADPTYAAEGFRAGAGGYLVKRSLPSEVSRAIRAVLRGQQYVSGVAPPGSSPETPRPAGQRSGQLTGRQREVLQLVAEGLAGKEIAASLGIALRTVEFHKAQIMARLRARSVAELTRYAVRHGIIGS
jgi:DNA-binding NarL/FixJ family response regulator